MANDSTAVVEIGGVRQTVPTNETINRVANIIYGEGASTKEDTMKMIGSSVLNRLDSGRTKEFGGTIEEIGDKGYYAVKDNTDLYQQATNWNFPDKSSENAYKKAIAIASGLVKGTIDRHKAQFYFTPEEIKKQKKKGKKAFDFDLVKEQGDVEMYKTFSY